MEIIPEKFGFGDIETRVKWINDERIHQTMFFDLPATAESTERWFFGNVANNARIDFSFFSADGMLLAMGGFTSITKVHNNAEFYVMVNPDLHGKGIGKKVSLWMYNYGFSVLDLNKIYLYTNDDNIAAYNIYEKAGFVLEGILREQKWKDSKFQNRRFYGLLQSEWKNLKWKNTIGDEI